MKEKTILRIVMHATYLIAFISMAWIDWRLMIPFIFFGLGMNIENRYIVG